MSTFDTFLDPDTGEGLQSKAFGKRMRTYRVGDAALPQRAPLTEAEFADAEAGRFDASLEVEATSLQLRLTRTGNDELYLDLDGGIFRGVSTMRDAALPLLDHHGRLLEHAVEHAEEQAQHRRR